ncbi:unnamed protein product [Macrosiphum euphorbiae]|uniref:Uncharacterized protein n=1 Tax=Macrosiphum euphorbiae TaxID=13131 RepID=A0AAV0W084_9HEMI|nr:unnamed protein product [Macrosiphum euphorbiae]
MFQLSLGGRPLNVNVTVWPLSSLVVPFISLNFVLLVKLLRRVPTPKSLTCTDAEFFFQARPRWSSACAWWGSSPTSPPQLQDIMAIAAVIFCTAAARC